MGESVNYGGQKMAPGPSPLSPDDWRLWRGNGAAFGACAGAGRLVRNVTTFCVQCGFIWAGD